MNYAIDSEFFRYVEVSDETLNKALNEFPGCLMVSGLDQVETEHKYAWFGGKIVVAPEGFELGSEVFFQDYEHSYKHDKQNETTTAVKVEQVVKEIPRVKVEPPEENFYNFEFFRQKRIHELEKDYPFEMIWALNRVWYLRQKKKLLVDACKEVSEKSGLDYSNIISSFNRRIAVMRWAKEDYKKSRN